jgi:hypothetical protein
MDLVETEARNDWAGEGQQQFKRRPTDRVVESAESFNCEKWEATSSGQGQFGKPEEGERLPL